MYFHFLILDIMFFLFDRFPPSRVEWIICGQCRKNCPWRHDTIIANLWRWVVLLRIYYITRDFYESVYQQFRYLTPGTSRLRTELSRLGTHEVEFSASVKISDVISETVGLILKIVNMHNNQFFQILMSLKCTRSDFIDLIRKTLEGIGLSFDRALIFSDTITEKSWHTVHFWTLICCDICLVCDRQTTFEQVILQSVTQDVCTCSEKQCCPCKLNKIWFLFEN